MVYDYHRGRDFASEGLELERPMFALLTPDLAHRYQQRFGNGFASLNAQLQQGAQSQGEALPVWLRAAALIAV